MLEKNKKTMMLALVALTIVLIVVAGLSQDNSPCSMSRYNRENLIKHLKFGMTRAQVIQALKDSNVEYTHDYKNSTENDFMLKINNNSLVSEHGTVNRVGIVFVDGVVTLYFFMFAFGSSDAALQHKSFLTESFRARYGSPRASFPPSAMTSWESHQGAQLVVAFEQSKTHSTAASAYTLMCRIPHSY